MTENVPTTRDDLIAPLGRAGELEVSGDNQAETDSYLDTRQFRSTVRTVLRWTTPAGHSRPDHFPDEHRIEATPILAGLHREYRLPEAA
jgi:hypothetical protein